MKPTIVTVFASGDNDKAMLIKLRQLKTNKLNPYIDHKMSNIDLIQLLITKGKFF